MRYSFEAVEGAATIRERVEVALDAVGGGDAVAEERAQTWAVMVGTQRQAVLVVDDIQRIDKLCARTRHAGNMA